MSSERYADDTSHSAWEDPECLFCVPAHHENCERYSTIGVLDRSQVPLGEEDEDHIVEVPVCAAHLETFQRYQSADSVSEVEYP